MRRAGKKIRKHRPRIVVTDVEDTLDDYEAFKEWLRSNRSTERYSLRRGTDTLIPSLKNLSEWRLPNKKARSKRYGQKRTASQHDEDSSDTEEEVVFEDHPNKPAVVIEDDSESDGEGFGNYQDDLESDEPPVEQHSEYASIHVNAFERLLRDMTNKGILVEKNGEKYIDFSILADYARTFPGDKNLYDLANEPLLYFISHLLRHMTHPEEPMSINAHFPYAQFVADEDPYFTDFTFIIPRKNTDFMSFIFVYCLLSVYGFHQFMTDDSPSSGRSSFSVWYDQQFDGQQGWNPEIMLNGTVVTLTLNQEDSYHRFVLFQQIRTIALNLFIQFQQQLDADKTRNVEKGYMFEEYHSVGSDEVLIVKLNKLLKLRLHYRPLGMVTAGGRWSSTYRECIDAQFPSGLVVPTNETDNLCMLYCIAMGIAKQGMPTLFNNPKYIPVNVIARRIDTARCIDKKARDIMQAIREREVHPLLIEIETTAGKRRSINELADVCCKIDEEYLGKESEFGLDVYYFGFCTPNQSIIPVYSSQGKNKTKRISILQMSFKKGEGHFAMISNIRKLYKKDVRPKTFYTCSKCHETFFTMELLHAHQDRGECDISRTISYAWNCKEHGEHSVGTCDRCHLKFSSPEDYEHHKRYCFLRRRTSDAFVQLAEEEYITTCDTDDLNEMDFVFFADFESYIKENGEHCFMSYGIYSCPSNKYRHGRNLADFITLLFREMESLHAKKIYVCFHNAMGYDCNFILRYMLSTETYKDCTYKLIMKSMNRMQALSIVYYSQTSKETKTIVFRDTFQFLTLSLDSLVKSMRTESVDENRKRFKRFFEQVDCKYNQEYGAMYHPEFPGVTLEDINIILRKNLYPYRWFTGPEALELPLEGMKEMFSPKEENLQFFAEDVIVDDLAKNYPVFEAVCKKFDIQNMGDYHDLYLLCDVMQLTDIFLNVLNSLRETHKMNLLKYIGMPSASWHAFLSSTPDLHLQTYTNTKFAEFFQDMTRGGVTSAPLRYAKSDATHSIIYLDVNGLYPYVMQQYKYPKDDFVWKEDFPEMDDCNGYLFEYFKYLIDHDKGACIRVDMHLDPRYYNLYDSFPLAPEHRVIKNEYYAEDGYYEFLEKWSKANPDEDIPPFVGLVGTLYPKKNYSVHWRLLAFYISHGMTVTKIHCAVEFNEDYYLRDYVSKNIALRNKRDDELGKTMYKLLGNSIYGKTFENPFNHSVYKIIKDPTKLSTMIGRGDIHAMQQLTPTATLVRLNGQNVFLDKPTYIGACVTEYAKLHMYQLFYERLMPMFENKVELVYTDTDSFIIRVQHEPDMSPKDLFDFMKANDPELLGKEGGRVKSETGEDDLIDEVIALRSKVYTYRTCSGKIGKRAKGTTREAQKTQLGWEQYQKVLFELKTLPTVNHQFSKSAFKINTVEMMKNSLSANDGKRYILSDGIHTHAFGHPEIPK